MDRGDAAGVSIGAMMILRIEKAEHVGSYVMSLSFNDGMQKAVDLQPLLNGPIFEPLKDPDYFLLGELDSVCGTVVWPNGADLAPEALHELDAVDESLLASNEKV